LVGTPPRRRPQGYAAAAAFAGTSGGFGQGCVRKETYLGKRWGRKI